MSHVAMRFGASVLVSAALWAAAGAGRPAVTRASTAAAEPATFSEDVAPILFRSCVSCHRAGAMGPMPLTSYQDARPWARAIRNRVVAREMPPWGADEGIGTFANNPTSRRRRHRHHRALGGRRRAEGDRARMPALPPVVEGWDLGTPDLVLAMAAPFDIPAEPRSVYGDFPLETRFAEDRFIEAAEVRPGAPEVTHHANVLVKDEGGTNRIASYSPGTGAKTLPAGRGQAAPEGDGAEPQHALQPATSRHATRARGSPSNSATVPCARSRSRLNRGPMPSTSRPVRPTTRSSDGRSCSRKTATS